MENGNWSSELKCVFDAIRKQPIVPWRTLQGLTDMFLLLGQRVAEMKRLMNETQSCWFGQLLPEWALRKQELGLFSYRTGPSQWRAKPRVRGEGLAGTRQPVSRAPQIVDHPTSQHPTVSLSPQPLHDSTARVILKLRRSPGEESIVTWMLEGLQQSSLPVVLFTASMLAAADFPRRWSLLSPLVSLVARRPSLVVVATHCVLDDLPSQSTHLHIFRESIVLPSRDDDRLVEDYMGGDRAIHSGRSSRHDTCQNNSSHIRRSHRAIDESVCAFASASAFPPPHQLSCDAAADETSRPVLVLMSWWLSRLGRLPPSPPSSILLLELPNSSVSPLRFHPLQSSIVHLSVNTYGPKRPLCQNFTASINSRSYSYHRGAEGRGGPNFPPERKERERERENEEPTHAFGSTTYTQGLTQWRFDIVETATIEQWYVRITTPVNTKKSCQVPLQPRNMLHEACDGRSSAIGVWYQRPPPTRTRLLSISGVLGTKYPAGLVSPHDVGAAVAERLACSPLAMANWVRSRARSLADFRTWESCRTMALVGGFFSRGSPRDLPRHFFFVLLHTHLTSPSSALKTCRCLEPPKCLHLLEDSQRIGTHTAPVPGSPDLGKREGRAELNTEVKTLRPAITITLPESRKKDYGTNNWGGGVSKHCCLFRLSPAREQIALRNEPFYEGFGNVSLEGKFGNDAMVPPCQAACGSAAILKEDPPT
ncbi:hypothetical protein PR048_017895 [Dryococelus australis]|uniref:Uncharacterized protein n=1 Tax=Dryococelus australis TaxID=614101 RepID=A0ABQ9HAW7_9NEOP|nr:hypothetical protein PR048_017895 [Dryococelus australis]